MTLPAMETCNVCDKILRILRPQSEEDRWAQLSLGSGREILQADMSCPAHEKLIISVLRSRADQPDKEIYAMLDFIEVLDVHKNPLNNVTIITATMSRDSPFPQPPPYGIYPLREPNDALNLTCGRLLSSQWIDNGLPRLWKERCTKLHSNGLCNRAPYKPVAATRPTWVVDVVRQCLVIAPAWSSYVALSYVWGTQKPFQTTLATLTQNQQAGALSSSSIGKTIRDAMAVAKLMAERYLWVDALCIVQDDEMHKRSELARMAAIYANAIVTIIAMQGENANSGLKGFRGISESRRLCQSQHSLKNGAEVTQFPIDSTSLQLGSTKTAWWNRGWTYQEYLFSRRRLMFDADSIWWQCPVATWWEHVEQTLRIDPPIQGGIGSGETLFQRTIPHLGQLQVIIMGFNKRIFSYPEDALLAFDGIAFSMSQTFAGGLVSGLPMALFDLALLWYGIGSIFRRRAHDPKKFHLLPSWSWAGWSGSIRFDFQPASDFIRSKRGKVSHTGQTRLARILSWKYHETAQAPGIQMNPSILESRDAWLKNKSNHTPCGGWTRQSCAIDGEVSFESPDPRAPPPSFFYTHKAYPDYDFWYPVPVPDSESWIPSILASYISCRTRRAWFYVAEELHSNNPPVLCLRTDTIWAGILQPNDGLDASGTALEDPTQEVELVEMAVGMCRESTTGGPHEEQNYPERPRTGSWYEYYWVMWVGWNDGVAHRKGLGRVQKQIWEEQRGNFFDLLLG